jgi:hypothetical protein
LSSRTRQSDSPLRNVPNWNDDSPFNVFPWSPALSQGSPS